MNKREAHRRALRLAAMWIFSSQSHAEVGPEDEPVEDQEKVRDALFEIGIRLEERGLALGKGKRR